MTTLIEDFTRAQADYTRGRLHTTVRTETDTTPRRRLAALRPHRPVLRHA